VTIDLGEIRAGRYLVKADGMMDVDTVVTPVESFRSASSDKAAAAHAHCPNMFRFITDHQWP
jgi:hypothetical protein